jgi:serine/threonine-protein kinase
MAVGIPLGPYRLVRRLATGGMAEIFLARQEGPDGFARELVVKRILPHLAADPEFLRMFRDEAKLAALLSHPNVVHVYDFGAVPDAEGTTLYLAMELVRGVDLRALILRALADARKVGRSGAIPPHHAAKIASFVCEGLAHAHSVRIDGRPAGIVHRDVTPSNVLLSFDGAVKLADFGIAKAAVSRSDETEIGVVKGKYTYLSPEQARGEPLDARSDLFNVGILLFESVLGEALFPPSDQRLSRKLSAEGRLARPERLDRLPPALAAIARKALSPRREDRYPDALALRSDLEAYVRACPEPSDTVELGRFVRQMCVDELQEDAQGPRAAGTVAGTRNPQGTQRGTQQLTGAGAARPSPRALTAEAAQVAAASTALLSQVSRAEPLGDASTTDPTGTSVGDATTSITPPTGLGPALFTDVGTPEVPTGASALVPAVGTATLGAIPTADPTPVVRARSGRGPVLAAVGIVGLASFAALLLVFVGGREPDGDPAAVALPRSANVSVSSEPPGARLFVDGAEHGVTPTLLTSVTAGRPLRLEVRDASGRVLDDEQLTLSEGETRTVHLSATPPRGVVRVSSEPPGAEVTLDGARLGVTPLESPVELGEHRVQVALDGFAPAEDRVLVEAAADRASLSFTLRPAGGRSEPGPSQAEPVRTAGRDGPRDGSRGERASPRGPTGTLRVATTPWSEVFEGPRRLGETPLQLELPAGRHVLTLRAPDRPPQTTAVEIQAGEVTRVRLTL